MSRFRLFYIFLVVLSHSFAISAKTIYVSSSIGSDNLNGLDQSNPLKTISFALKQGDTVLLKAGDVFYEHVSLKNKVLSRYGDGNNPMVCGFKFVGQNRWERVSDNIWRLYLKDVKFDGYKGSIYHLENNIGCLYEYDKDILHANKVIHYNDLKKDWDIWQTDIFDDKPVGSRFDYLYLYYTNNPNELNLALTVGAKAGIICDDSEVIRINVRGFGFGGITLYGTCKVTNCKVDIIGGSTMTGSNHFSPLGNGIDFWVSRDATDCIIEDCYISRCFDCGCSIQAIGQGQATPRNIVFRNNLISNCCQGWEDFLCNDDNVVYEQCYFKNNIVVNSGDSGFGYLPSRKKYCNILGGNNTGDKGMIIENNLFIGGNYYCSYSYNKLHRSNLWISNTFYTSPGHFLLFDMTSLAVYSVLPNHNAKQRNAVIKDYRELTNDYTTRIRFISERRVRNKTKRVINSYLSKHNY